MVAVIAKMRMMTLSLQKINSNFLFFHIALNLHVLKTSAGLDKFESASFLLGVCF